MSLIIPPMARPTPRNGDSPLDRICNLIEMTIPRSCVGVSTERSIGPPPSGVGWLFRIQSQIIAPETFLTMSIAQVFTQKLFLGSHDLDDDNRLNLGLQVLVKQATDAVEGFWGQRLAERYWECGFGDG